MAAEPIELHRTRPEPVAATGCACGHGGCCGGDGASGEVVLDARDIPHAIRHATIFGALGAIAPGSSLDLLADHDPVPLVSQLEERRPDDFEISYIESGPEVWRLRFTRN